MFNTMTLTKVAGALIGAALFLMLTNWAAEALYHVGPKHHVTKFGEEPHAPEQAYTIAVAEAEDAGGAEEEEAVDVAALMASADAAAGEKAFGKCKACHKMDGTDGVGPHLNGVVGRQVAAVAGFAYSEALVAYGGAWEYEPLYKFLENPRDEVPGTKMAFAGIRNSQERVDLIAYLESVQ